MLAPTLVLLLAQAPASAAPAASPTPRPAPAGPVVVLDTSAGRIRVGLHQDKAPGTVANFLKYVRSGHYDGTVFHRVIPNFMIQGGGMDASLNEKPTLAPIRNEARNRLRNLRGTVAMARTNDPDSAAAQFFINLRDNAPLDFGVSAGYAVFGEVLEGMDVVDRIAAVRTTTRGHLRDVPETAVVLRTARVVSGAKPAAASPRPRPSARSPRPSPRPSARP